MNNNDVKIKQTNNKNKYQLKSNTIVTDRSQRDPLSWIPGMINTIPKMSA
eukprot:UN29480